MRDSIRSLQPHVHTTAKHRYASIDVGKLTRVQNSGYKLEGGMFATAETRDALHAIIDELLDRLDLALEQAPP